MFDTLWNYLQTQAQTNAFFSGAALTGIILGILHTLRGWFFRLVEWIRYRITVSINVHSTDSLFIPLCNWLAENKFDRFAQKYRWRWDWSRRTLSAGPDYGTYFFRVNRKWMRVNLVKEEAHAIEGQPREFLTVSYFGLSRKHFDKLAETLRREIERESSDRVTVFFPSGDGWRDAGSISRSVAAPILPAGTLEDIERDLQTFLGRKAWYEERSIPYRRGYLLKGLPGTGKTSLVRYLAAKFDLPIYSLSARGTILSAGSLISRVPKGSILLLEDIDRTLSAGKGEVTRVKKRRREPEVLPDAWVGPHPDQTDGGALMQVFQGSIGELLNSLDGLVCSEGVVVVMTTNHPERLDPALIRPGRVDYPVEFDYLYNEQAQRMIERFYRCKIDPFEIEGLWTAAQLQELLVRSQTHFEVVEQLQAPGVMV